MKAIVIDQFGGPEKLQYKEVAKPIPQDQEVLIQVAYAGVNPVDWKVREGHLTERLPHEFPIILGWDVAGVVAEIGKRVVGWKMGDRVYAYGKKAQVKWGTYAEFVAIDGENVAKMPHGISFAQAASLPLISLTAWQSLFDAAHLKKGETILILAGSGGVGSMGIQFAKQAGAKILTTASPPKHPYVQKLGADFAIDYQGDFVARVKEHVESVDVVFDCFGGDLFHKSLACLKRGGRAVSLLEHLDPIEAANRGIASSYVFVKPNGEQLKKIAELIEEGKVVPPLVEEIPLQEAALAQERLRSGKVFGKLVLKVA